MLAPRAPGQARSEMVEGVRVRRYRLATPEGFAGIALEYALAWVQLSVRLAVELARGAEVVHLHNPPDTLFAVAWLARLCGRRVIFDHHDLAPELYEQKFGPGGPATVLRWCERMTMRSADVVLAANESHRQVAIEWGGVDPGRVVVVRNGPREATIMDRPQLREGAIVDPHLCFVGALGAQDGVSALPEVLARLNARGLEPTLTIVGDGPEVPTIRSLAEKLGVLEQIVFTGRAIIGDDVICGPNVLFLKENHRYEDLSRPIGVQGVHPEDPADHRRRGVDRRAGDHPSRSSCRRRRDRWRWR